MFAGNSTGKVIREVFSEFVVNRIASLAAALAYYTIFSLPALLLIVMRLSDIFYGRDAVEGKVYSSLVNLVGRDSAAQIQETIRNTSQSHGGQLAAIVGIIILVFGATGIFVEIQDSINQIWHLKPKPRKGRGFLKMLINRAISFSMIGVLGFMLLVSLIINSIMDIFLGKLAQAFPDMQFFIIYILNFLLSFLITALLLAIIFKVLPDAHMKWKDIKPGVIVTTLLFMAGKFLISYYLGKSRITSSYGAAGSVIATLLWVYYSSIILFVGAIFTRVYAIHRGSHIHPNDYAVWVEKKEIESEGDFPAT